MDRELALQLAQELMDAGFDVTVSGRAGWNGNVLDGPRPEVWALVADHRRGLQREDFSRLFDVADRLGVDVFSSPGSSGLWFQVKR